MGDERRPMTDRLQHLDPDVVDHVPVDVFNALVDVVNTLCDGAVLYEAHVENLIERTARIEQHLWPEEWTQ